MFESDCGRKLLQVEMASYSCTLLVSLTSVKLQLGRNWLGLSKC